eukprot:gnl/TRDRNA2_/TRDRNA2_68237_c0_seq1.p1 gnl/TRDRNA2_/TRDRNA2_68237_c0~~gnl/TRDRNA2_/TRDRNA2_68237_c0_seq1.p1  ORF type:complete len:206 (-),score=33.16 gnl/TRDRNA2_/TRDRNA2_68237_c0_seq1:73-690(-)
MVNAKMALPFVLAVQIVHTAGQTVVRREKTKKQEMVVGPDADPEQPVKLHANNAGVSFDQLRQQYLATVRMGLLGGLNHAAITNPAYGATDDYITRNKCLATDWETGKDLDICIIKWDGDERLQKVGQLYDIIREQGIPGDLVEAGVWRGGITIYMKALLRAWGDEATRSVWVIDSFKACLMPRCKRWKDISLRMVPQTMFWTWM